MRTLAAVTLTAAMTAGPASGFFFPNWPGSGVPPVRSVIPPEVPPEGNPPSATPPGELPPPLVVEEPPGEESPPGAVPEPMAVVSAVMGLAALAVARMRRRGVS